MTFPHQTAQYQNTLHQTTRVLVVDDEKTIADVICLALQAQGMHTHHVMLAQEAYACFQNEVFDVIVLDVGLPDGNGFELVKKIRRLSSIPILLVTALNDEVDRIVGLEIGADDYISKPFSPRELAARVKVILRRTQPAGDLSVAARAPTLGRFTHDETRMAITFSGVKLVLTTFEYRLLCCLLQRPEQIFSRQQLMDAAGAADASMERTVDTHIKTLRAKLKEIDPHHDPLITHRGVGYSIVCEPPRP